jgi:hypothetical protein
MCIVHNNAYNDSCNSKEDTFICRVPIKRHLHSPCHENLWLSSLLFQLLFYYLCSTTITHDSQSILVFTMLISYCWHCVSIALLHVQAIVIFQSALTIEKHSSSFPHITTSAPLLLASF